MVKKTQMIIKVNKLHLKNYFKHKRLEIQSNNMLQIFLEQYLEMFL